MIDLIESIGGYGAIIIVVLFWATPMTLLKIGSYTRWPVKNPTYD